MYFFYFNIEPVETNSKRYTVFESFVERLSPERSAKMETGKPYLDRPPSLLRVQTHRIVGTGREHPRLGRMEHHVKHGEIVHHRMVLQPSQWHDQWVLQ